MEEEARKLAGDLLRGGKVTGVLGLRRKHGQVGPHLFTKPEELGSMVLSPVHVHAKSVVSMTHDGGRKIGRASCRERV